MQISGKKERKTVKYIWLILRKRRREICEVSISTRRQNPLAQIPQPSTTSEQLLPRSREMLLWQTDHGGTITSYMSREEDVREWDRQDGWTDGRLSTLTPSLRKAII